MLLFCHPKLRIISSINSNVIYNYISRAEIVKTCTFFLKPVLSFCANGGREQTAHCSRLFASVLLCSLSHWQIIERETSELEKLRLEKSAVKSQIDEKVGKIYAFLLRLFWQWIVYNCCLFFQMRNSWWVRRAAQNKRKPIVIEKHI